MSLTMDQQNAYDIARWRWRAEVLDYDAALYDQIGKTKQGDDKRAEARYYREMADATEDFVAATTGIDGMSETGQEAGRRLHEARAALRSAKFGDDRSFAVHAIDDYNEPSPAELGVI